MCYADNVAPLELEGVKLACLSGDNGHGKSALLEAITWVLWGKARAKSDDELVHLGRSEMEVQFDFDLGGVRYRIIRKRSIKRSGKRVTSTPTLEFQVLGEDGYRTISGNSVHETQRKIGDVLRMDYDTFINSSFILQNRADEFTIKPPAERKRVLADILGLQIYDELEERARELSRQCETERRELAVALREIESELARKPDYEAQLTEAQKLVEEVEQEIKTADASLWLLRERKRELDQKAAYKVDMQQQVRRLETELQDVGRAIEEQERRNVAKVEIDKGLAQFFGDQAHAQRTQAASAQFFGRCHCPQSLVHSQLFQPRPDLVRHGCSARPALVSHEQLSLNREQLVRAKLPSHIADHR